MNFGKILIAATALLAVVARFSATAALAAVFEEALQQQGRAAGAYAAAVL